MKTNAHQHAYTTCTLPVLSELLIEIRQHRRPRLHWDEPVMVPCIVCRHCGGKRLDDGTRCPNTDCARYQYPEVQTRYELWQRGLLPADDYAGVYVADDFAAYRDSMTTAIKFKKEN
jgi:hypothetical protein